MSAAATPAHKTARNLLPGSPLTELRSPAQRRPEFLRSTLLRPEQCRTTLLRPALFRPAQFRRQQQQPLLCPARIRSALVRRRRRPLQRRRTLRRRWRRAQTVGTYRSLVHSPLSRRVRREWSFGMRRRIPQTDIPSTLPAKSIQQFSYGTCIASTNRNMPWQDFRIALRSSVPLSWLSR